MSAKDYSPEDKIAIVLLALGQDIAAELLKRLAPLELNPVLRSLAKMNRVPASDTDEILANFAKELNKSKSSGIQGGKDHFQGLLTRSFSAEKALELANDLRLISSDLKLLEQFNPEQIVQICSSEHPQTAAVILAHLPAPLFAKVFKQLANPLQIPLLLRVANLQAVDPAAVEVIRDVLTRYKQKEKMAGRANLGGRENLAKMLAKLPRDEQAKLLEKLSLRDQKLAEEIEKSFLIFSDILRITTKELSLLISKTEQKDWLLALRGASQELKEKVWSAISPRSVSLWQDELEASKKVLKKDVLDAQQRIALKLKNLCEDNAITSLSGEEYV